MIEAYRETFERYCREEKLIEDPVTLNIPIEYILSLGGKRIRPALVLMAYELFEEDYRKVLPQALAVELFHNFSLMHDDIMDQAPLRRGQQTVHLKYGVNAAILSGDAMLILSYKYLVRGLSKKRQEAAVARFTDTALKICQGQQLDLDFESEAHIDIQDYLRMIRWKTAVLLGTALALGALRAGARAKFVERLYRCGTSMGVAFQIQDDLLDAFGNPQNTGKQRGGDIIQNKRTFLYLKARDLADPRSKQELDMLYSAPEIDPQEKVNRVLEIYQALGIESHAHALKKKYALKGLRQLEKVGVSDVKKHALLVLMKGLLDRDH